jgi:predicted nuclease of predicted toxin-antitoxin system
MRHGRDEGLAGADDPAVLAAAVASDRVLVTMDHDFGNVLAFPPQSAHGIVIVNLPSNPSRRLLAIVLESFLSACRTQELRGKLWIVEPGRIREHQSAD